MKTTNIYTVSTFNLDSDINTVQYKGESYLQADLKMQECIKEGKHGAMLLTTIKENAEYNYYNENTTIYKNF